MLQYGQQLYSDLMNLCSGEGSSFFYVDQSYNEKLYKIFGYRIASYTEFLQPNALECRGHTFEIDDQGNYVKLVSLPFRKFFNNEENPFTQNLDFSKTQLITDKLDGSLISISKNGKEMMVKSKTSFYSEQAQAAKKYIENNKEFAKTINDIFVQLPDVTVNCELTAPWNRIVLLYPETKLTVLQIRSNLTGEVFSYDLLQRLIPEKHLVPNIIKDVQDKVAFVESIPEMKGIEGYVLTLQDGQQVKIKTEEYLTLHRCVSALQLPKHLFECVVNENHDDLRGIMKDSPEMLSRIDRMENEVKKIYKLIDTTAVRFYNQFKDLTRKEYAIKALASMEKKFFTIAMELWQGKEIDYKEFIVRNWESWNLDTAF